MCIRDSTPSIAHWKARGWLYIRYNWTFFAISYGWDVKRKSVKVGVSRRGWVTFSTDFREKGALPTNRCWCQSSRVIALLCGIKMSAAHHLDLSQSTCVTDRQTDGQNYDSQDRLAYARAAKNSIDRCKKTQFKRQCKGQTYKTAEIILLCHEVMCLFRTEPFTCDLIAKRQSELPLQVSLVFVILHL